MCQHSPACPDAASPDHDAARVVSSHPEQGWSLLCNGVVVFEDTGEILPDGRPAGGGCPCSSRGPASPAPPDRTAQPA
jgi:hypothetical protein